MAFLSHTPYPLPSLSRAFRSFNVSRVLTFELCLIFDSDRLVYVPEFKTCTVLTVTKLLQGTFEACLVFELTLFGLTLYRAIVDYRCQVGVKTPLLRVMYRGKPLLVDRHSETHVQ